MSFQRDYPSQSEDLCRSDTAPPCSEAVWALGHSDRPDQAACALKPFTLSKIASVTDPINPRIAVALGLTSSNIYFQSSSRKQQQQLHDLPIPHCMIVRLKSELYAHRLPTHPNHFRAEANSNPNLATGCPLPLSSSRPLRPRSVKTKCTKTPLPTLPYLAVPCTARGPRIQGSKPSRLSPTPRSLPRWPFDFSPALPPSLC